MLPGMPKPAVVEVSIQKLAGLLCMEIKDDGKSFQVDDKVCTPKEANDWDCSA